MHRISEALEEHVPSKTAVATNLSTEASMVGVPKVTADLKPGTYKYDAKISMGDQQMALNISTAIQDGGSAWTAIEYTVTPIGAMLDTAILEKGSLTLRKRSVKQGPVSIHVEFSNGKAVGTRNMNGEDEPFSVDLDGPLFADAAGAYLAIGCLPLADGYTTSFRNFDLQKQKAKLMELQVAGPESVTVPAGTFDAFKVELSSTDGGPAKATVWIAKDTRRPVKMSRLIAEVAGATLTAELLP